MATPSDLRSRFAAVRRRWRMEVLLRACGRIAAAMALPLAAVSGAAWLLGPTDRLLTILIGCGALLAIAAAAAIAWRVPRSPDDRRIARFIEERAARQPDASPLDEVLLSAVGASGEIEQQGPGGFAPFVLRQAIDRLDRFGPDAIIPAQALRRAGAQTAIGVAVLGLSLSIAWPALTRASEFAWISLFPQSVRVEVLPGNVRVPTGKPVSIRATVRSGHTALTRFTPALTVSSGGAQRSVSMTPDGDGFSFSFESIDRSFQYVVSAGSARSEAYTVTALFAPRVQQIDVHYEYPSFANLAPRDAIDGGDIYAPAGTKVRVRVHTDKPIASGRLALGGAASAVLARTGDRVLEGDLVLSKDDSYRIGLTDVDGLQSAGDSEYFIRVMDDRPPTVRIMRPASDEQITPLEEVAIEARADDDYGLSRFELVYAVAGREPKVIPFTNATGTDLAKVGTHVLAAEDLQVQPGDFITYYARARDVGRGKRPTETRSDMFFLEIRPFSEEFVSAQSQASSNMAGDQLDSLITAQKEIISATWNVERRATAGAGRSQGDVSTIAGAQSELKTRVEQLMGVGAPGRGFRLPQQIGPGPIQPPRPMRSTRAGGDPIDKAVSAMGRAIDQLQGQRTADALPHEMLALQALLQLQAEIRRREVSQQGAGMSGSGRQGQDLSALFDKELQRQQRTNYETRSQAELQPEKNDSSSALEQIRDLARRQEELNRRQRELAESKLAAEEAKRQLEKLTREQEALRQQADQLARQMSGESDQSKGSQPQRGGSPRQGQSGSGEMRDAADEMRAASGELQRQSPTSAAERGEKAAAQLRRLEQQIQGSTPEARQRAAGELQLEAQQIADEQRRIAGAVDRLGKDSGAPDADAWRRLAGDKESLADRVDELQRAMERLGSGSKQGGTPAASGAANRDAGAAARDLEEQQIARRMREGAKDMRDASGALTPGRSGKAAPRPRGDVEQQLARALDGVAERLGGTRGDAADLSRRLDETRAMRDRLDRLERQIRDAQSKEAASRQGRGASASPSPSASGSGSSDGQAGSESQRLQQEYGREMQRARETLSRLERGSAGGAVGGSTPEEPERTAAELGTEAFKQDFSKWESLRKDVDSALERYEATIVATAARRSLQDRLSAGGSDRVPDAYRRLIARYYESLARKK